MSDCVLTTQLGSLLNAVRLSDVYSNSIVDSRGNELESNFTNALVCDASARLSKHSRCGIYRCSQQMTKWFMDLFSKFKALRDELWGWSRAWFMQSSACCDLKLSWATLQSITCSLMEQQTEQNSESLCIRKDINGSCSIEDDWKSLVNMWPRRMSLRFTNFLVKIPKGLAECKFKCRFMAQGFSWFNFIIMKASKLNFMKA